MNETRARLQNQTTEVPQSAPAAPSVIGPRLPAEPANALQVLTLAQRTAAEHIAVANRQADVIRRDARSAAEQVATDAHQRAREVRRRADTLLAEATEATEKAQARAKECHDDAADTAKSVVAQARAEADEITRSARQLAGELQDKAQQRYEDAVGGLRARREALQQQIEALERFDSDYRSRLISFMQSQLRALWADRPDLVVSPRPDPVDTPADDVATLDEPATDAPVPAGQATPSR